MSEEPQEQDTPDSVKPSEPLTVEDITQTRNNQSFRMRWPRDPDTTRRLKALRDLEIPK